MSTPTVSHGIDFVDSLALRLPALDVMGIKYAVVDVTRQPWTPGSKAKADDLLLERVVSAYSQHEQDVINWVRNPFQGLGKAMGNVDEPVLKEFAKAVHAVYVAGTAKW